jgi:hypothetical protein
MTSKVYSRFEIAVTQLEAAIGLYIANRDKFSVITLAGAANTIFCGLLAKSGKETFTDSLLKEHSERSDGQLSADEFGSSINNLLGINHLKHLDPDQPESFEIEPNESALATLLMALTNYLSIPEHDQKLFHIFKIWAQDNLDKTKYNVYLDPNWIRTEPNSNNAKKE